MAACANAEAATHSASVPKNVLNKEKSELT